MPDKIIVGTVVGVTNPREFYFSITPNKINVQDLVLVDTYVTDEEGHRLKDASGNDKLRRAWAKVMDIERINPLFPEEAGHELAFSQTSAFDTVISLSREMITAKCKIFGIENEKNEILPITYPLQPASSVYLPQPKEIENFLIGNLAEHRKLEIGHLRSRESQKVYVDAHAIVARHLAVLAGTGSGKTVTVRKLIEKLAEKNYPMLILDKHGDYQGLKEIMADKVDQYRPNLYLAQEDENSIVQIISGLSGEVASPPQDNLIRNLVRIFQNHSDFITNQVIPNSSRSYSLNLGTHHFYALLELLNVLNNLDSSTFPITISNLGTSSGAVRRMLFNCADKYRSMRAANQFINPSLQDIPMPRDIDRLVQVNKISILNFEGYDESLAQVIIANIMRRLKNYRIIGKEIWIEKDGKKTKEVVRIPRFLTIIEEAHNYIPGSSDDGYSPCVPIFRQIATEGRKYGMGLIVISQRPSRIESTILSQCNSFIIMKIINPADQSYIGNVIESIGTDDLKLLPDLATGEAVLTGQFVRFPILVKVEPGVAKGKYEEEDFIKEFVDLGTKS